MGAAVSGRSRERQFGMTAASRPACAPIDPVARIASLPARPVLDAPARPMMRPWSMIRKSRNGFSEKVMR